MTRVLVVETGDDWRALAVPEDWDIDDVDRYLNGTAYGRAAVLTVEQIDPVSSWQDDGESPDPLIPTRPGQRYGDGV